MNGGGGSVVLRQQMHTGQMLLATSWGLRKSTVTKKRERSCFRHWPVAGGCQPLHFPAACCVGAAVCLHCVVNSIISSPVASPCRHPVV